MLINVHKCLQHQNFVLLHMHMEVSDLASYTTADVFLSPSIALYPDWHFYFQLYQLPLPLTVNNYNNIYLNLYFDINAFYYFSCLPVPRVFIFILEISVSYFWI